MRHHRRAGVVFAFLAIVITITAAIAGVIGPSTPKESVRDKKLRLSPGDPASNWDSDYWPTQLYAVEHPKTLDQVLTTDIRERSSLLRSGYVVDAAEPVLGYAYTKRRPGTTPLYRFRYKLQSSHYYSTQQHLGTDAGKQEMERLGFVYEGITGHVYEFAGAQTTPVRQLTRDKQTRTFYSTSPTRISHRQKRGWSQLTTVGHILTTRSPSFADMRIRQLSTPRSATQPAMFDDLFTSNGDGWLGSDGTISIPLPDGRILWVMGDGYIGTASNASHLASGSPDIPEYLHGKPRRERNTGALFVRNSLLVQTPTSMLTLSGGRPLYTSALNPTDVARSGHWYWGEDGTVEGSTIKVLLARMAKDHAVNGEWGFKQVGVDVATLQYPQLGVLRYAAFDAPPGISWGNHVVETPTHTYVYGLRYAGERSGQPHGATYAMRARAGKLLESKTYEYWTGTTWSSDAALLGPMRESGTSSAITAIGRISVVPAGSGFAMVHSGPRLIDMESRVRTASSPEGPWSAPRTLFKPPNPRCKAVIYNYYPHPQFNVDGNVLFSYNINGDYAACGLDAYRPRFVAVPQRELIAQ
jgi:hypothetical protein